MTGRLGCWLTCFSPLPLWQLSLYLILFGDFMYKQVLIEIPYVLVQATAYVLVVYSMLGFAWTPAKFFWFYYITVISLLMFTYYGMMMVAITPNVILASIVSAFFSTLFNLYAGFLIPRPVRTKTLIHHTFSPSRFFTLFSGFSLSTTLLMVNTVLIWIVWLALCIAIDRKHHHTSKSARSASYTRILNHSLTHSLCSYSFTS